MKPSLEKKGVAPGYLRKSDAAAYLGIAPRTLQEWAAKRIVPAIRVSHRVTLFRVAALDEAMLKLETKARGAA